MINLESIIAENRGRQRRHGDGGAVVISAPPPSSRSLALLLSGGRALSPSATRLPAEEHWNSDDCVLIREPDGFTLAQCLPRGPHKYGEISHVRQRRAELLEEEYGQGGGEQPDVAETVRRRRPSTRQQKSHGERHGGVGVDR